MATISFYPMQVNSWISLRGQIQISVQSSFTNIKNNFIRRPCNIQIDDDEYSSSFDPTKGFLSHFPECNSTMNRHESW